MASRVEAMKLIRGWRICTAEPEGLLCWFDPLTERLELWDLTDEERSVRLDMVDSVSAPEDGGGVLSILQGSLFPKGSPHGS